MKLKLSTVLLLPLVIFFITQYRLSWENTPFWLFTLIFSLLISYIVIDLFKMNEKYYDRIKSYLLLVIIVLVIASGFISSVIVRHRTAPIYGVHDIILQQEAAIRYVIHGKNPYKETYFGTPLEAWHYSDTETNPALYHFVMEPFYLLFAIPFYFSSNFFFGFFDARVPLYLLFLSTLLMAWSIKKNNEEKRQFITLLALNPVMLPYILEGRSDMFMYAFLFFSLLLLTEKRLSWSGVFMGLAFAIKQSTWPIFPFYLTYIYLKKRNIKKTLFVLLPFLIIFTLINLPFMFWDINAFLDSTVFYLSGSGTHSYPISGYGVGMLLNEFGLIRDLKMYFPFILLQLIICIPLVFILIRYQIKHNTTQRLIIVYGIFLFVYWYLSRYFNNSHMGYLSMIFVTAYFWPDEKNG